MPQTACCTRSTLTSALAEEGEGTALKGTGLCVVAISAAIAWGGSAYAEFPAEYGIPPAPGGASAPQAKVRPSARAPLFAASSVANARPMPAQQREERRFLKDAAATSRFQADAARIALARSTTPVVRSLAAGLLDQQRGDGDQLLRLLRQRSLAPPMLANIQRKTLNRLARLQGRAFDREFVVQVALRSQHDELRDYEKAATSIADPVLRGWVEQRLPTLRDRLATAERVAPAELRSGPAVTSRHAQPDAPRPVATRPSEWNSR